MSVTDTAEPTTIPVVRRPAEQHVLDAFEIDIDRDHDASPGQEDFTGDGESLYLDVAGFFDLDDEIGQTARSLSVRRVV